MKQKAFVQRAAATLEHTLFCLHLGYINAKRPTQPGAARNDGLDGTQQDLTACIS
jgi:hypothetical protein